MMRRRAKSVDPQGEAAIVAPVRTLACWVALVAVSGTAAPPALLPDARSLLAHLTLESMHTVRASDVLPVDWIVRFLDGDGTSAADTVDEPGPIPEWATTP